MNALTTNKRTFYTVSYECDGKEYHETKINQDRLEFLRNSRGITVKNCTQWVRIKKRPKVGFR